MSNPTIHLLDPPGVLGRTTISMLGSLAARLATLTATSGSDAVGSMTAGYAALGREAARTAEGARMRAAIEQSRAGANGEAIWRSLRMDAWASSLPPTAVLQQFYNDLALLVADDLDQALELPITPAEPYGATDAPRPEPAGFADYLVGLWVFGTQVATAIEQLAGADLESLHRVIPGEPPSAENRAGPILR